jgi:FtsP/CotA-like multicopper oxidase with cupredoxin domain
VDETPGTYFWHDHAALNRADGLQGALVVLPPPGTKELYSYDADRVLFLQDWWHFTGDSMAMRLNRCGVRVCTGRGRRGGGVRT